MIIALLLIWALTIGAIVTAPWEEAKDSPWKMTAIILLLLVLVVFTGITIWGLNNAIQQRGIDKFLDKEIVIDKTVISYDSQNQPIDTTYTFKYNK